LSFQTLQAKYRRLYQESATWRLLRAVNAPQIVAFLADLFAEESEISFSRARVSLDAELNRCRNLGIWETETGAGTYLNQWIRAGWLREMDDILTKTDACEVALRFCQGLDDPSATTTASHLRIVQESVRDFVVALSPNIDERVRLLKQKRSEIQREIDSLQGGVVTELSVAEQRERIREVYQLASVLTGDFRRVEDEIRRLDQELRIQIIEGNRLKGDILLSVMEKEDWLAQTDAGSAFESFFQLLCDQDRSQEFREQLREILAHPVANQLGRRQQQYLGQLMRELSRESGRVLNIRGRTEESLRAYIESGSAQENRAVGQLLSRLERLAVGFGRSECNLQTAAGVDLPVGTPEISSPDTMRLRAPEEQLDGSGIEEQVNSKEPSLQMLQGLDDVRVRQVADRMLSVLNKHGPMSIASIAEKQPIDAGLEELIACIRVAKAVGAPLLADKEPLVIRDRQGEPLEVTIPVFLLSAILFPQDLNALTL